MKIYIILLTIIIIFIIVGYNKTCIQFSVKEPFGNYSSNCKVPELLKKAMNEKNIYNDNSNYEYYIPCSYNRCEKEVLAFENKKTGKKLFLIDGCDWIASKLALWELLKEEYGLSASKYMPTTYLLENKTDLLNFPKHYEENKNKRPNQMYVLKNYAQRQEGIKLTRNLDDIVNGLKQGWYLVQDYVYNPYIISKRKINLRYYLLVICYNGNISGYIHKDGFVYYTPKYYDENDIDFNKHITTGYIDRKVYETNPLTLQDFRNYLDKYDIHGSKYWDSSAEKLMNSVMKAISKKICKNNKLNNHVRFQLFGCDLAPNANLGCTLMEINKGPDLGAKDERDKQVKLKVQQDIFTLVETTDSLNNTRFVKIF